jgi:predicted kinase
MYDAEGPLSQNLRMATLFMICGLPGSGKSTLARQLADEHRALRLAPDEWMARIVGDGYDEHKRTAIEAIQWELAQRVLVLGVDVILENGFWSRAERDEYRARAAELGVAVRLYYLEVSRAELVRRLATRNEALPPATFRVEPEQLDAWMRSFEPPALDEEPHRLPTKKAEPLP